MVDQSNASIEALAARWLRSERRAAEQPGTASLGVAAAGSAEAYDRAIKNASEEELLDAWEAARRSQSSTEVGSAEWTEAGRVTYLLGAELRARVRS